MRMFGKLILFGLLAVAGSAWSQDDEMVALSKALSEGRDKLDKLALGGDGKAMRLDLNLGETMVESGGTQYDGIRLTVPKNIKGKDFVWYFNVPEGWSNWYILPLDKEVKAGFRNWVIADKFYEGLDKPWEKNRFRTMQVLEGGYFEPGAEYVLWFRRMHEKSKGKLRVRAAFSKSVKDWDHEAFEKALGLKPLPAAGQVKGLDSLGGKILLDEALFEKGYAAGRIDSLFFSMRQQKDMEGGFFIQIATSTPPCNRQPKLSEIVAKYGKADFIRSSSEKNLLNSDHNDDEEEPIITHYYDYFGFEVSEEGGDGKVLRVNVQANDFRSLQPKEDSRATFGKMRYENLTAFHMDGEEVGRIYLFDEEQKEPVVIKAPPVGTYTNGDIRLSFLGEGKWTMKGLTEEGEVGYVKRYASHRLEGITEVYFPGGKLKMSLSYKAGLPDGKFIEYDEEGGVVREMIYREGKPVEEGD
ncbi:MAG: hypothetical protein NWR03_11410 [Akkermansiaceae bacterium]|nr:hypothetical protein [Akkermansiaceae bacterium]